MHSPILYIKSLEVIPWCDIPQLRWLFTKNEWFFWFRFHQWIVWSCSQKQSGWFINEADLFSSQIQLSCSIWLHEQPSRLEHSFKFKQHDSESEWSLWRELKLLQIQWPRTLAIYLFFCQEQVSCQQSSWKALFYHGVIKLLWMQKLFLCLSHCLSLSRRLTGTVMLKYLHIPPS